MAKQPETLFKEKVKRDLETLRPDVWFVKVQQHGIRGTPDILMCAWGTFVALELKKDGKEKAEPLQEYNLDQIRMAGGYSFVTSPDDWEGVFEFLKRLNKILAAD